MEAREGITQALRRVGASVRGVANGDTEDVVQEAVARALKSGVSLEAEQWLRTVAKRVAIDKHRRRREMPSGAPADLEKWTRATDGDPEDEFIRAERSQAVREALTALPPRYQKALLAYAEEDSPAAVANRLGLSAAATWTLLSRARSRLRMQLEQVGFVPALVFNSDRPRLRTLLAAGAVAAAATGAALVPKAPPALPDAPLQQKVQVAAAPDASAAAPKPTDAVTDLLPVAPEAVTETVGDVVSEAKQVRTGVKVGTCVGRQDRELGIELSVIDDQEASVLAKLLDLVPEPLRETLDRTCP